KTADSLYQIQMLTPFIYKKEDKKIMQDKISVLKKEIYEGANVDKENTNGAGSGGSGTTNFTGGGGTEKNYTPTKPSSVSKLINEPDSMDAPIANPNIDEKLFVPMYGANGNNQLGAWPKNANLDNLSGSGKVYGDGKIIFPCDADGGSSYEHAGIDLFNKVGTPVYAVADGTIMYSEWGHTVNKAKQETAYSVKIKLDKIFEYDGKWAKGFTPNIEYYNGSRLASYAFYTHMIGIRYRANSSIGTRKVKQGELIGWTGYANAPHLHLSIYDSNQKFQISTADMKKIYGTTGNSKMKKAGQ
ncbi:MAG: M23 family metallopeptidase, partial [Bacilli bacterium]